MQILELALQGVRGFSPSVRATLRTGYLILAPPTSAASPLCGLATAILFADGRGGETSFLAPGQKSGKSSFVFLGNDHATYRVTRELGGTGGLQRFDKVKKAFESITEDAGEMGQFLRAQA